jgi:hypothetical protein
MIPDVFSKKRSKAKYPLLPAIQSLPRDSLSNRMSVQRRRLPMTICAAALCRNGSEAAVLAISDRMITSGDIERETDRSKMYAFSPKIICLGAGNQDFHYAINIATHRNVSTDNVTSVSEVAELYTCNLVAFRRKRAAQTYYFGNKDSHKFVAAAY